MDTAENNTVHPTKKFTLKERHWDVVVAQRYAGGSFQLRGLGFDSCFVQTFFQRTSCSKICLVSAQPEKDQRKNVIAKSSYAVVSCLMSIIFKKDNAVNFDLNNICRHSHDSPTGPRNAGRSIRAHGRQGLGVRHGDGAGGQSHERYPASSRVRILLELFLVFCAK